MKVFMKFTINVLTPKEFSQIKESSVSYYQTDAGTLQVFSNKLGIYKAIFVVEKDNPKVEKKPSIDFSKLLLVGTDFQIKVWQSLLQIPTGKICAYEDIAKEIGQPNAYRAAGNAISNNKIAYFIPCHRVIRKNGELGGYRWGVDKKIALLKSEGCISNKFYTCNFNCF